jgi:excinuclease UvrABC nuclease subunit
MLFDPTKWKCANTFDTNYAAPPCDPGVYVIRVRNLSSSDWDIAYIGSAKNLKVRYSSHEILRMLRSVFDLVQFYWMAEKEYRQVEKTLIKTLQPKYNKQWR